MPCGIGYRGHVARSLITSTAQNMPAAAAAAAPAGKGWKNIRNGAVLQCCEAITLGMPLEVWKTRMGRMRSETTMEAFWNIQKQGGGGLMGYSAFWKGTAPKMVESASKGAVLIYAKEAISESCGAVGIGAVTSLGGLGHPEQASYS